MTTPSAVVLVGPSGAGKSTLFNLLNKNHPGVFGISVSHTTRQPRAGEEDGVHYHFVDVDTFKALEKENAFIETAEIHGNFYGTTIAALEDVIKSGSYCVLDIDFQGAINVKKAAINAARKYIFILPPSREALRERLMNRGTESEDSLARRLETAEKELDFCEQNPDFFDAIILNDNLETAYQALESIIFNK